MASKVKDILHTIRNFSQLVTVNQSATVQQAAEKMAENRLGCLIVESDDGRFVGIFSERDLLSKVISKSLDPHNVPVTKIMNADIVSCSSETSIAEAEKLMARNRIRHLAVVDGDKAKAMLSSRDISAYRLHNSRVLKAAAEQLAQLASQIRYNDFNEVTQQIIQQVPGYFQAEWALLYLEVPGHGAPILLANGCRNCVQSSEHDQFNELCANGWVLCGELCTKCRTQGGQAPALVVPLEFSCEGDHGKGSGFLCMCRFANTGEDVEQLKQYKASLLRDILNANLAKGRLLEKYKQARRESRIDSLTGTYTRRVLEDKLKEECYRANRYSRVFAIAMLDVDNLKAVNDTAGHAAGDAVLKSVASVLVNNIRSSDAAARFGGDEFVVVMPETNSEQAEQAMRRLHVLFSQMVKVAGHTVGVSCGIAASEPDDDAGSILNRADKALYAAKNISGNSVAVTEVQRCQ